MKRFNLWAPWRLSYIKGLTEKHECFICHNVKNPQTDADNFVLWRTKQSVTILNRFPYNNGHLLVCPIRHVAELDELNDSELLETSRLIIACQKVLKLAINPHGFNVGMNFGRSSGAGLPAHLHIHIVPRWDGDTNFMEVCANTNVISQSLKELYQQLKETGEKNNLPSI